jgi:hypothetical protein
LALLLPWVWRLKFVNLVSSVADRMNVIAAAWVTLMLAAVPAIGAPRSHPETAPVLLCKLVQSTPDGNIQVRGTISIGGAIVTNSTIGPKGMMVNNVDLVDLIRQRCPGLK